ncbi:MAG: hypothetical protein SFT91_03810 [Rickettsiaceae bacterium]|nr:hypothetical protein [Rickettsiaceae bacterium]
MKNSFITIIFILIAISLSSCAGSGIKDLKKSASNKYIDMKGFHKSKRKPIYNKKYITQAKKNIYADDFDDEDEYDPENIPPSMRNIAMYREMIKKEQEIRRLKRMGRKPLIKSVYDIEDEEEPDLHAARASFAKQNNAKEKSQLESEIAEIKIMLQKTKDDLARAKCIHSESDKSSRELDQDIEGPKSFVRSKISTPKILETKIPSKEVRNKIIEREEVLSTKDNKAKKIDYKKNERSSHNQLNSLIPKPQESKIKRRVMKHHIEQKEEANDSESKTTKSAQKEIDKAYKEIQEKEKKKAENSAQNADKAEISHGLDQKEWGEKSANQEEKEAPKAKQKKKFKKKPKVLQHGTMSPVVGSPSKD